MSVFNILPLPESIDPETFTPVDLLVHIKDELKRFTLIAKISLKTPDQLLSTLISSEINTDELNAISRVIDIVNEYNNELPLWLSAYEELSSAVLFCEESLKTNNSNDIALSFYALGNISNKLNLGIFGEIKSKYEAALYEKTKKNRPLKRKSQAQHFFKTVAQHIAIKEWDSNPDIRITQMAEHTQSKLIALYSSNASKAYIPKINAFKDWVREIAPDSAKKGGRPRNN